MQGVSSRPLEALFQHLEKLLGDAPVEKSWEGTCVEVRPHGSSCGHGLMQLLTTDLGHGLEAARYGGRGFDFVLALGNFSARDEDLFLQLHTLEATPDSDYDRDVLLLLHDACRLPWYHGTEPVPW